MKEFTYKKYSPEYKQQVLDLESSLWHFDDEMKLKYFNWKYEDNPYTDSPEAYIALDGDKVVAFRGFLPQQFCYGDSNFILAACADTVTHPDYRRMGLFKNVTSFAIEEMSKNPSILVSTNSSSGGPTLMGYVAVGWKPMCARKHLFRFSIKGIIHTFFHKKTEVSETEEYIRKQKYILSSDCRSHDMSTVPFEYKYISHIHDETYIRYRYSNPIAKYIFLYKYDEKDNLNAYIALLSMGNNKFDIIDFNGPVQDIKQLLDWGVDKLKPKFLTLWTVGNHNCIIDNKFKFGFISLDYILDNFKKFRKPPFLVRQIGKGLNDLDISNVDNWELYKVVGDEI